MTRALGKKIIAATLAAALIAVAPGLGCYRALAQGTLRSEAGHDLPISPVSPNMLAGETALGPALSSQAPLVQPSMDPGSVLSPNAYVPPSASEARTEDSRDSAAPATDNPAGEASAIHAPTTVRAASPGVKSGDAAKSQLARRKSWRAWLSRLRGFIPSSASLAALDAEGNKRAGERSMDAVLGQSSSEGNASALPLSEGKEASWVGSARLDGLASVIASGGGTPTYIPPVASGFGSGDGYGRGPSRAKFARLSAALARIGLGAGLVAGAHFLAVALAPTIFGLAPLAAAWAMISGAPLAYVVLKARYRLTLHDSPRLGGVKFAFDLVLGALLGAAWVAWPGIAAVAASDHLTWLGLAGFSAISSYLLRSSGGFLDSVLAWVSLAHMSKLVGIAAAGTLSLGPLAGLLAFPVLTMFAFYLGRIIDAADTGRSFSAPASVHFPAYTWVMMGVVFALFTGYAPIWVNPAFFFWTFFGGSQLFSQAFLASLESSFAWKKAADWVRIPSVRWLKNNIFNLAFLGIAAWSAATGFAAPVTFLALAFAPERASAWTVGLLRRLLPAGNPAPSTAPASLRPGLDAPQRWPQFHFYLKTAIALGNLALLGVFMGGLVLGWSALLTNLAFAGALSLIPFLFSPQILRLTMRAQPLGESEHPEVHDTVRELVGRINQGRARKGLEPIPVPPIFKASMGGVPNAAATGPSPRRAMVIVTDEILRMLLEPEALRQYLIRLFESADPSSKAFHVFRMAVRARVAGIPANAGPREIAWALRGAAPAQLKELGERVLRGVLGHELTHVMDRHMLVGAIAGTLASAVAFACYGALWSISHAGLAVKAVWRRIFGRDAAPGKDEADRPASSAARGDSMLAYEERPAMLGPVSGAAGAAGVLLKVFPLWAPVLATILQMASSRVDEGDADAGGVLLTEEPEMLALGLGLLTAWRPAPGFRLATRELPLIAAQAHMATVSPLEQLLGAGTSSASREDNSFFNLFITHPDTSLRIERLHDMAEAFHPPRGAGPGMGVLMAASKAPAQAEPGELVDPDGEDGLIGAGLDERLLPVVETLKARIESTPERYRKLGHLGWALSEFLNRGGAIRYANLSKNEFSTTPDYYDPSIPAIYLDDWNMRLDPLLQAAALVRPLQRVYDSMKGRLLDTRDAPIRQDLALAAFLDDVDLQAWAERVHINNPAYVGVFEGVLDSLLKANFNLAIHREIYRNRPNAAKWLKDQRAYIAKLEARRDNPSDAEGLEGQIALAKASLELAEKEFSPGGLPPSALSAGEHAVIRTGSLPMVRMKSRVAVQPRLERAVEVLKRIIAGEPDQAMREAGYDAGLEPDARNLSYLVAALERALSEGGRVFHAVFQDPALFSVFSCATADVVLGRSFVNIPAPLQAMILGHELGHEDDYFNDRSVTLESELKAHAVMAQLAGAFDPMKLAAGLDPRDPYARETYAYVYGVREKYLQGRESLAEYVRDSHIPTQAERDSGQKSVIQQTAAQRAVPVQGKLDETLARKARIDREIADLGKAGSAEASILQLLRAREICEAYIRLYERMLASLKAVEPFPEAPRP